MGLSLSDGRGQNPYQQHLDKPYEPVTMPLGKHIDKHIKKLEEIENIDQLLVLVINMCALLGSQGKIVSRQALVDLLPTIKEKTKISASTWNSRTVYALAGIGAVVSIAFGLYSSVKTFEILSTVPQLEDKAKNLMGVVSDIAQQGIQMKIQNQLALAQNIGQLGSGISQAAKSGEEIKKGHDTGVRQVLDMEVDMKRNKRDHLQQTTGSQGQKADEYMQMAQRMIDELYRNKKGG